MIKFMLIICAAVALNAHSLKVFAKEENGFVLIKSYFYGNSPCKECKVELIKDNKILSTVKTDSKGEARAKIVASEFDILVDGGLAHEKRVSFKAENPLPIDTDDSTMMYVFKFIAGFAAIAIIFGCLYIIKRRQVACS
ncbi:hypothetical protein [Campylobacter fetus]|uniref:Co/Ni ABC transporter CbiKLMQO, membrane protein CbiL n=1 Tax=Campylobacter fetus TaxID=196 RepID=A0A5L8JQ14_CAMFE|nr:hypothetical protein [Campylobacter fetus]HDX6330791.1 hypothetical protein [Campylobacter fetus subsp. venerealis]AIR78126.1 Co/Ni ABC transporter CbiKLMQO, membrane protein CbiL [Campylobacter fetus subsp. fetus 04/554]EAI4415521.1 hypothetical protein [Campylobacter fetus]EAI5408605.1 hypothetical protein [Campylobacter fetus]EAJ0328153.1 hypothetical protein [Campylobacter fetus]